MQKYPNNLTELFILIYKKKNNYFTLIFIVGILSAIVTFFIPNQYNAAAIIYPYNYIAFNPKNISEGNKTFGSQEDVERIQQIALSKPLVNHLNRKFDLYSYYEIDTTKLEKEALLYKKFNSKYDALKNSKGALEIQFIHKDPVEGACIVNESVLFIDSANQANYLENYRKTYQILLQTITEKDSALKNFQEQDIAKSSYEKSTISIAYLENIKLKEQLKSVNLLLNTPISSIAIIEKATPNYKKESPKFLINIVISIIASLSAYTLYLLLVIWYKNSVKELL